MSSGVRLGPAADAAGWTFISPVPLNDMIDCCLPLMHFIDCGADMPPLHLPVALRSHTLRADLQIFVRVPDLRHPWLHAGNRIAGTDLPPCAERTSTWPLPTSVVDSGMPSMLILASKWSVAIFSAQPEQLSITATCDGLKRLYVLVQGGVQLSIDLGKFVLQQSTSL